ncbi:hypothetical protein FIBSPDRAFT_966382 [Athelia psychrophila]|uniref:DNase I-like protein n=1 Tax=Athelia psychrophila TaxID=1759441 RepID=A0A167WUQ9_9AGAM|nr:hypothetical protein FIBSPDRAFT_966382 [Fibularhizoctonia sp. CBS 109695]
MATGFAFLALFVTMGGSWNFGVAVQDWFKHAVDMVAYFQARGMVERPKSYAICKELDDECITHSAYRPQPPGKTVIILGLNYTSSIFTLLGEILEIQSLHAHIMAALVHVPEPLCLKESPVQHQADIPHEEGGAGFRQATFMVVKNFFDNPHVLQEDTLNLYCTCTLMPSGIKHENLFRTVQRKAGKSCKQSNKEPKKPLSTYFMFLQCMQADLVMVQEVFGLETKITRQCVLVAAKQHLMTDGEPKEMHLPGHSRLGSRIPDWVASNLSDSRSRSPLPSAFQHTLPAAPAVS